MRAIQIELYGLRKQFSENEDELRVKKAQLKVIQQEFENNKTVLAETVSRLRSVELARNRDEVNISDLWSVLIHIGDLSLFVEKLQLMTYNHLELSISAT